MKKRGIIFLIACMLTLSFSSVQAGYVMTDGFFTYILENGTLEIKSVSTTISGSVTLSSRVAGYPVTSVGPGAFQKCVQLNELSLPESITDIGANAFQGCIKLRAIHVAADNPVYFDDQGVLYTQNKLLLCPLAYSGKLTVPASITEISEKAAEGCSALTEVAFPATISKIGGYAFSGCTALTKAFLPDAALYIGEYTFKNCIVLTEAHISDMMKHIPNGLFYNCIKLAEFAFPSALQSIGDEAFYAAGLTCLSLSDSMVRIGKSAFQMSALQQVVFPESLESIGNSALSGCRSLRTVQFSSNIKEIQDGAFQYCVLLKEVILPASVKVLGNYVFQGCDSLLKAMLPQELAALGYQLFFGCEALTAVTLPGHLKEIGSGCFHSCTSLQTISLPETVKHIGKSAFMQCLALKYITLPPRLTCIESDIFRSCVALSKVEVPPEVVKIGENAFRDSGLAEINLPAGLKRIETGAFQSCKLTTLTLPDTVTTLGDEVFRYCTKLQSVYIPYSVTDIGAFLFYGAKNPAIYCDIRENYNIIYGLKNYKKSSFIPFFWHVSSEYIGQRLALPEIPERNGYTVVGWYRDKDLSQAWDFENDTVTEEMTLYARWGISTGRIMMTGDEFSSPNADSFTKEIRYLLPEDTNGLNLTFRYDACSVAYQSIEAKAFRYCFVSEPQDDPENPGFKLLSVICKYNDSGSCPGNTEVNPFNLKFRLQSDAPYTQKIEFVQGSPEGLCAYGMDNEPIPFTQVKNGMVWNSNAGSTNNLTISGNSVITAPTSYTAEVYPPRTPQEKPILWFVSDPCTASIDSSGRLTPLKNGTVIVTAQTTDGSGLSAARMVTIGPEGPKPKVNGVQELGILMSSFSPDVFRYNVYLPYYDGHISFPIEFDDGLTVYTYFEPSYASHGSSREYTQSGTIAMYKTTGPSFSVSSKGRGEVRYEFNLCYRPENEYPPPLHLSMFLGETAILYNVTNGWTSKNKDIATVDQNGVVKATGVGRAILTHPDGWECRVDIETSGLDYTLKNPRVENGSLLVALQNDTQRHAQDTLITAFYDADGSLLHMNAQKLTSDMAGEILAGTVPAELPCSYAKIFVWEGANTPTSLSNAAVLRELQTK